MSNTDEYWIGLGDIHDDTAWVNRLPDMEKAQGVIISGDLTTRGGVEEAGRVIRAVARRNPSIMAQIGNMDRPEIDSFLHEKGMSIHLGVRPLAQKAGIMGVGTSTPTPFGTPSEFSDDQLAGFLSLTHARARAFERLLLVVHDPPHNTKLDIISSGLHVGSRSVRRFIEKVQPDLCLTGHVHEAPGIDRIGRTLIVNPGPAPHGGYALIRNNENGLTASLEKF